MLFPQQGWEGSEAKFAESCARPGAAPNTLVRLPWNTEPQQGVPGMRGLGTRPGQALGCGGGGAKLQSLNVKLPRLHTRVAEPVTVKSERAEKGKSEPGWKSEAILVLSASCCGNSAEFGSEGQTMKPLLIASYDGRLISLPSSR